ncbi:M20/M25/M40 family metallo-hydrolase [bacterium]|nr:MAG: M20/M25/M40 family metallo-hydrolase [bacterium]
MAAAGSLVLLAAAVGIQAAVTGPDFDQGVAAKPALAAAKAAARLEGALSGVEQAPPPPEEGVVWISVGKDDLTHPSGVDIPLGAPVMSSARASVYRVTEDRLPAIAEQMHDKFHKCGGFFAHGTREEAAKDLQAPPPAAAVAFTVDQGAVVRPIVAKAQEAEIRSTIETLAAYNNRYYTADTGVQAAQWIGARWSQLAKNMPGASLRMVTHSGWKQPSVVLTVPGSEKPEEIVVLGGHLDSISGWGGGGGARAPGADDNASGIATLTEAVRLLGEAGFRPKRTLQFMGYAAEEVGLRGSADIAKQYKAAGTKVVAVIQFDMTNYPGSGEPIFLLTDNVDPSLTAHLKKLVEAYTGVPAAETRCGYGCSDHASWTRSGYPASAAFESAFDTMNHQIHTDRDTLGNAGGDARHSVAFAKLATAFAIETAKPAGAAGLAPASR